MFSKVQMQRTASTRGREVTRSSRRARVTAQQQPRDSTRVNAYTTAPPVPTNLSFQEGSVEEASVSSPPRNDAQPYPPFQKEYAAYKTGYQSVDQTCETEGWAEVVQGSIPEGLTGTLLRNGPAMFHREVEGKGRVEKSYLDGDGMVVSVAFKDGGAYFRNKFVRTEHYEQEEAAGDYVMPSIFTPEDPRGPLPAAWYRFVDDCVMGDIERKHNGAYNVMHWAGSTVAQDYSKPYELNSENLDTIGFAASPISSVRQTSHFRCVENTDGSGKHMVTFLNEVNWRSGETVAAFHEFDEEGVEVGSSEFRYGQAHCHDLVVTDNWYVLFDCPIKIDFETVFTKYLFEKACLSESICEDRRRSPKFRLFPRPGRVGKDGKPLKPLTLDCPGHFCYAYHHVNGFESQDGGKVVFDTCSWDKFTLYFNDIVNPDGVNTYPQMRLSRFVLDLDTLIAEHIELDDTPCELPVVNWDMTGKPYEHMYLSTAVGRTSTKDSDRVHGPMQSLTKVTLNPLDEAQLADPTRARVVKKQVWEPEHGKYAMEPFFVKRSAEAGGTGAEDDGWVLALVHDANPHDGGVDGPSHGAPAGVGTQLVVLDAQKFDEGPVATLKLPRFVPFGVHGSFTHEYISGPPQRA